MIRDKLIIFVKAPLMGRAKTRLAADIGPVQAWRLYRAMTAHILREVNCERWDIVLAVTPSSWIGKIALWDGFYQYAQSPGSLSPRLAQAFSSKGKTVVIGSDCPQLNRMDIYQAFKAIGPGRCVFGPASDGGFWLMGAMGPLRKNLFTSVRWSSPQALWDMEQNLRHQQIIYLRTLTDIDDLTALRESRP